MTYASFARGYKASGFNLDRSHVRSVAPAMPSVADLDTSFDKELVDSYEVGAKTQWVGNSLLLNASVFYQDYTDFQLNTFDGVQFVVTSLRASRVARRRPRHRVVHSSRTAEPARRRDLRGHGDRRFGVALANPGLFSQHARRRSLCRLRLSGRPACPQRSSNRSATDADVALQRRREVHVRVQHRFEPRTAERSRTPDILVNARTRLRCGR